MARWWLSRPGTIPLALFCGQAPTLETFTPTPAANYVFFGTRRAALAYQRAQCSQARQPPPPGTPLPARPKAGLVTRAMIAAAALAYKGLGYVYGGDASRPGLWDCSSFVSFVLGFALRMTLPGGGRWGDPGYPPNDHGPVVVDYAHWDGAVTIQGPPAAGDLCLWPGLGPLGHMGIAISGSQMISALNPQLGTRVTPIAGSGPAGVAVVFRRLTGAADGGMSAAAGAGMGAAGQAVLLRLALLAGLLGVSLAVVVAGVAVAGAVIAARAGKRAKASI